MACQNCNYFEVVLVEEPGDVIPAKVKRGWFLNTYDIRGKSIKLGINFCPNCGNKPGAKVDATPIETVTIRTEFVAELFHAFANISKDVATHFSGEKQ